MKTLTCPNCNGTSQKYDDKVCRICDGEKVVAIDRDAIVDACLASRGKNKGMLRASKPKGDSLPYGCRYVWRMARFHSGQDVTMPVTAGWDDGIGGIIDDDCKTVMNTLDPIVDFVARNHTPQKTDMGAAFAWKGILY